MRTVYRNDDPPDQEEQPCAVCGRWPNDCICPECPICGVTGDSSCYVDTEDQEFIDGQWITVDRKLPNHGIYGMIRSDAQKESRAKAEAEWEAENREYYYDQTYYDELRHKAYLDDLHLIEEAQHRQALEDGLGMVFDNGPTDAEVNRAQRRLEELFGKDWLEGKE